MLTKIVKKKYPARIKANGMGLIVYDQIILLQININPTAKQFYIKALIR